MVGFVMKYDFSGYLSIFQAFKCSLQKLKSKMLNYICDFTPKFNVKKNHIFILFFFKLTRVLNYMTNVRNAKSRAKKNRLLFQYSV